MYWSKMLVLYYSKMEIQGAVLSNDRLTYYIEIDAMNNESYLNTVTLTILKSIEEKLELIRVLNRGNIFLNLCQELFKRKISLEESISIDTIITVFNVFTENESYKAEETFCTRFAYYFLRGIDDIDIFFRLVLEFSKDLEILHSDEVYIHITE